MIDEDTATKPEMQVIRAADQEHVAAQVSSAGGRVVRLLDDSSLIVELPSHISPASIGAEQILVRRLSPSRREVTSQWRRVRSVR